MTSDTEPGAIERASHR